MFLKTYFTICFFTLTTLAAFSQDREPLQIADIFPVDLSSTNIYSNNSTTGIVYTKTFTNKGSAYVKLHLNSFDLKDGDFLKVYSPITNEEFIYSEKGKIIGANKEMISEFWTETIWSNKIIIELHKNSNNTTNFGFNIDEVAYGHSPERINETVKLLDQNNSNQRTVCNNADNQNIACYQGTEMGRKSQAVCRLLINGGSLCTGWLLGCDGNVMTNDHCIESATDAANTSFLFNYQYTDCAGTIDATSDTQATSSTLITSSFGLDFALVLLPVNPSTTYGFLSLSSVPVTDGERIYIPNHSGGRRKEIAVNSDTFADENNFAIIIDAGTGTTNSRVSYTADTEGGASGSPVIRHSDNLVVAIHNSGGCPNGGAGRSDQLIAAIGANMPNCGVDNTNPSAPYVTANNSVLQPINEGTDCAFQDVNLTIRLAKAATQITEVPLTITGGTATNMVDFELLTPSVSFPIGDFTDKTATLRIYNDAITEAEENIIITLGLNANGGNAVLNNINTFNVVIKDDDYTPNLGNRQTLFFNDFESDLSNFTVTGTGTTNFAISNTAGSSSSFFNTRGNDTNFAFVNDDSCDCDMSAERLSIATPLDFTNYTEVHLNLDLRYTDHRDDNDENKATLEVSTDNGITWITIGDEFLSTHWKNTSFDLSAYAGQPSVLVSILYGDLGFWSYGVAVDNFKIEGYSNALPQTALNTAVNTNLRSTGTVNLYDNTTKHIVTTITNNDTFNYGCVAASVTRAGNSGQAFQSYSSPFLAMDKVYTVTSENANTNGNNTITFYFTEAEVAGWETAIINVGGTVTRSDLAIYRGTQSFPITFGTLGTAVTMTGTFSGVAGEFYFAQKPSTLSTSQQSTSSFAIFPNPVKNTLTIQTKDSNLPEEYLIYNVLGQVIDSRKVNSVSDLSINTSRLSSGLYFIKLNADSNTQVIRFIKK